MMLKASLLAFVAFLAVACAAPSVFLGGAFTQVDGVWSPGLGAFNTETQSWSHYPIGLDGTINSLAAVRNGTFAVGTFTAVGSSQSQHVAFWDGVKWCPIRQGIAGNGLGVVCDSDTSCWVAGDFTGVYNLEVEEPPRNFVHYLYNTNTHEWEIDTAALNWNNASGDPAPVIAVDSLDYIGSGNSMFFFALSGNQLFRGSAADEGWFLKAAGPNVHAGASTIFDYSINPEGSSLYVVTDAPGDGISVLTGTPLSSACGGACTPTAPADWNSVVTGATPPYNASVFNSFSAIVAGPSDTRYLIGVYDPDGLDPYFIPRPRVLQQTGSGQPTLVGSAFDVSPAGLLTQIGLTETNGPLVVGTFLGANLFYPTTPNTNDIEGLMRDRRPLDAINGIAVYDTAASRWVPFGAGGISGTPSGNVRMTYNTATNEWFVADAFQYVYDTHAVALAYHETTEDAFFPVLTRALLRRGSTSPVPARVFEVICETSDCGAVFVGGDFAFHGPDTFGAILRAVVKTSGEPELSAVGGGLWDSIVDYYLNDTAFQVKSGEVMALKVAGGNLYAGGAFTRTAPSAGFHCLNNIARIDASTLNGQWEDVAGGCDNYVFDIEEFQGRLYVGGAFAKCGDVIVNSIASYSHAAETPAWGSLNHGVDGAVYSLEPFQGRLIVGGSFSHAGGLPVTGVASWDGTKWRALIPACSDDCVPGDLQGYYNVPEQPTNVWGLQRDSTGRYLFATGSLGGDRYLVRWHYTEGDFGQWLVKGAIVRNDQDVGHSVAIFVDNQILVAGSSGSGPIEDEQPSLGAWDQNAENIAVTTNVGGTVYVARGPAGGSAGSASTLSSMLSPLLAYVF